MHRWVGQSRRATAHCATCGRSPLPGEVLHHFASGRVLCTLCVARLPDAEPRAIRVERIHVDEHRLDVAPRLAV